MKTEMTPNGLATYSEPTFRTYEPESVQDEQGRTVLMQLCEEWVASRWEPFFSVIVR